MGLGDAKAGGSSKSSRFAGLTYFVLWSVCFYAARPGRSTGMPSAEEEPSGSFDAEVDAIHEVVPARAVLTELARGFLLVHESNRAQAVQFATTFLKERAGRSPPTRVESIHNVTMARLSLGRFPQGAVERLER
ncbi:MAG: hypothetical protein ACHQ0I_02085 [Candidatus Lutacidiplasmatales archaeon]